MGAKQPVLGTENHATRQSPPVRLKIPLLNVDAPIEGVGITADGSMGVPQSTSGVGWFVLGPQPGELGSAVLAGHFNGRNGETGVFANIASLKPGDRLIIEDSTGQSLTFIVRESRTYDPGYGEDVFSSGSGAHLNLVTCDGFWDSAITNYSKRLVVFSDLAD